MEIAVRVYYDSSLYMLANMLKPFQNCSEADILG